MATVRDGNKGVLVVVDVQVGVVKDAWQAPRVVANVARVVQRARAEAVPVVWVQHSDENLVLGSAPWQWVPELVPADGEPVIHKHFNSAFEQTSFEQELARLGATHLVLAGAQTNWCIRATAYGALERGYDLTLVSDAHTTETLDLGDGSRLEAAGVVQDLNLAMRWLSYPGRSNGRALADEVVFDRPGERRDTGAAPALHIELDDLTRPQVLALLQEHLDNMHELSPPEQVFALDVSKLRAPDISFWTIWQGAELLGCGALKQLTPTHGEIKSMRTPARRRRRGAGQTMLSHLVAVARERGYARLSLETGTHPDFGAAHALYARAGFSFCGPFGGYREDPHSVFMSLAL
ncbi:MAG: hypothetical protein RL375_4728 [Pseudomonadota bacterium]